MRIAINKFYLKYIRKADPGFFITKYAGKAAVSCLVSFLAALLFRLEGGILFWWMAGAVCTVLFRTGSTLKRRKMYALALLALAGFCVPAAALAGMQAYWGLGIIFLLSFFCFFISSLGVSASTIGTGCLVVSLISFFSPADLTQGALRSVSLFSGGLISFCVNFYLWPFDPEKVLLSSAKIAVEDMGLFFEGLYLRIKTPNVSENDLAQLSREAADSVRRYRVFMESFNIDPLKGSRAAGGPGLFYFSLIRLFEALVGLLNHVHFTDGRPEYDGVKKEFYKTAGEISVRFDTFPKTGGGPYEKPDFQEVISRINGIQEELLNLGAHKRGEAFLDAWGAVYELKNVARGLEKMISLADERFRLTIDMGREK